MNPIAKSVNCAVAISGLLAVIAAHLDAQQVDIVPFQSNWDYLFTAADDGTGALRATDPFANSNGVDFTQWNQTSFITSPLDVGGRMLSWQTGPAVFGFGDNAATGTVLPVPASGERDAIHYFRHEFTTSEELSNLTVGVSVDDGAVVYLDGQRLSALNSCCKNSSNRNYDPLDNPDQPIPYGERATVSNGPCRIEGLVYEEEFAGITLSPGPHVLAVSVHSISANSADMRFDMRLFQNVENEYRGDPAVNGGSFSGAWGEAACGAQSPVWASGSAPDSPGAIARLRGIPTRDTTIYADQDKTVGTVIFDNANRYAITGHGTFDFATLDGSNALIDVLRGDHEFQTTVALNANLDINVAAGASIEFNNDLLLQGNNLSIGGGGGDVEINNNLFADGGNVSAMAATVAGSGSIHGNLFNHGGMLAPGDGIGVLTVAGDVHQSADAVLEIELAAAEHDVLRVLGQFDMAGELRVVLADGFTPGRGDSFTILEYGSQAGDFESLHLPAIGNGLSWELLGGELTLVPESSGLCLLVIGGLGLTFLARRFRVSSHGQVV